VFSLDGKSLYVRELDLWIDSMRSRDRCYVSHGHADHAREHDVVVATPNTARICRTRFKRKSRRACSFEEHAFNEPWDVGDACLTLFSAGHVLGSSQLLIEGERGRFVYTGDFKLASSLTAEPTEVKRCDVLLMECTFGQPHYVFPPRDEVAAEMTSFARDTLDRGAIPLFYAYSLGKAQEAMALLGGAGIPLVVHPTIATMAQTYADCGVALPAHRAYDQQTFAGDAAVIWPPSARALPWVAGRRVRDAVLTGWAMDRSARYRYGATRAFALSDHADYPSLLRYIEMAQPTKVLLMHGRRDFTDRLRRLGIDAEYLEEHAQLALL